MIQTLRVQNFRCYSDASFEFEKGVNIIVGPNACGKTSLIEAVFILAKGSSLKTKDKSLIKKGKNWSRIDGFLESQNRVVKIDAREGRLLKTIEVESKKFSRLPLAHSLPTVVFEPSDLQLTALGPQNRRDFIDKLISQTEPGYKKITTSYERALAQKNRLLKTPNASREQHFVWNVKLSELGGQIVAQRTKTITQINKKIPQLYSSISGKKTKTEAVYLTELNNQNYSSQLLKKLENQIDEDKAKGFASYGPHREDIAFWLAGLPADTSASRGETRTLLLALKIFETELVEATYSKTPLLLLDDVFSELDASRRRYLVDFLKDRQTLITTTDADAVIEYFSGQHRLIPISI